MRLLPILFFLMLLSSSCERYTSSFEVVRDPQIRARVNDSSWVTNRYSVQQQGQALYFDDSLHQGGTLFYRYTLVGLDAGSDIKRLQITLDVVDPADMRGIYTPRYTEAGGLFAVEWIDGTRNQNNLAKYTLCTPTDTSRTVLEVERQQFTEQLIAGTFRALLCGQDNANDRLSISEGTFKDINYNEE